MKSQFSLTLIFSWTTVIAILAAIFSQFGPKNEELSGAIILIFLMGLGWLGLPNLIEWLIHPRKTCNGILTNLWLIVCVSVYPMLMLMLSSIAFEPDWKGSKGMGWIYYALDWPASVTIWLSYLVGGFAFMFFTLDPAKNRASYVILISMAINALISWYYVFACLVLSFSKVDGFLAVVPASAACCYSVACAIWFRLQKLESNSPVFSGRTIPAPIDRRYDIGSTIAAISIFVIGVLAKYPLAWRIYQNLPDEQPEGCFVVTAAARGHRFWVGSWFDEKRQKPVNSQLVHMWEFERLLKAKLPLTHLVIRKVYNRVGPMIARRVRWAWQADLLYILLKPVEWIARMVVVFSR